MGIKPEVIRNRPQTLLTIFGHIPEMTAPSPQTPLPEVTGKCSENARQPMRRVGKSSESVRVIFGKLAPVPKILNCWKMVGKESGSKQKGRKIIGKCSVNSREVFGIVRFIPRTPDMGIFGDGGYPAFSPQTPQPEVKLKTLGSQWEGYNNKRRHPTRYQTH